MADAKMGPVKSLNSLLYVNRQVCGPRKPHTIPSVHNMSHDSIPFAYPFMFVRDRYKPEDLHSPCSLLFVIFGSKTKVYFLRNCWRTYQYFLACL